MRGLLTVGMLLLATQAVPGDELAPLVNGDTIATLSYVESQVGHGACQAPTCTPTTGEAATGWWAAADLLYWRPHMRGLDYAATDEGLGSIIGPSEIHHLTYDRNAGIRAQLGHVTKAGWGVNFTYTSFNTDGQATVSRPPGVGRLFSTTSHPAAVEEADVASSLGDFQYDVFDAEARYLLHNGRFLGMNIFGGLRWARIEQDLFALYDGRDYVNGVIQDELDVEAFGVRLGVETQWRMANGFSVFARGALGALYAEVDNTHRETNLDGADLLVAAHESFAQPTTNVETAAGISWTIRGLQVAAGYELAIWEGIYDRFRFIDDIEEGNIAPLSNDILLEGFFFRAALAW